MDEMNPAPRRRKKSQMQIFKETRLPLLIWGTAVVLILIFITGAVVRSMNDSQRKQQQKVAQAQQAEEHARLDKQCQSLLDEAAVAAENYDYKTAIAILDRFEGDPMDFPRLHDRRTEYLRLQDQLVAWADPAQIPNFSVQMLIADPDRAFNDGKYGKNFTRDFLTVEEFTKILDKLYENGYVLVRLQDVFTTKTLSDGTKIFVSNTIYLPEGKKPFVLTQTNVNYHTYLVDGSDADKLPDANGRGFACKLVFDDEGNLTNEYVDSEGTSHTGSYDMIPILEAFIREHPDFSYRGARAVIAVTGYDGLFGYRTNSAAESDFDTEAETQGAVKVATKLQQLGYELACYTYANVPYGSLSVTDMETDLRGWVNEVPAILPDINIFVFAQNSDIAKEDGFYNDRRFTLLNDAGFEIFLGFCSSDTPWAVVTDYYVRQGRILLTPQNIMHHPERFGGILSSEEILDANRGEIPR